MSSRRASWPVRLGLWSTAPTRASAGTAEQTGTSRTAPWRSTVPSCPTRASRSARRPMPPSPPRRKYAPRPLDARATTPVSRWLTVVHCPPMAASRPRTSMRSLGPTAAWRVIVLLAGAALSTGVFAIGSVGAFPTGAAAPTRPRRSPSSSLPPQTSSTVASASPDPIGAAAATAAGSADAARSCGRSAPGIRALPCYRPRRRDRPLCGTTSVALRRRHRRRCVPDHDCVGPAAARRLPRRRQGPCHDLDVRRTLLLPRQLRRLHPRHPHRRPRCVPCRRRCNAAGAPFQPFDTVGAADLRGAVVRAASACRPSSRSRIPGSPPRRRLGDRRLLSPEAPCGGQRVAVMSGLLGPVWWETNGSNRGDRSLWCDSVPTAASSRPGRPDWPSRPNASRACPSIGATRSSRRRWSCSPPSAIERRRWQTSAQQWASVGRASTSTSSPSRPSSPRS